MRKTIIKTLFAAVLMCSLLTATAFAESATVTGSEVNMRSGPGLNYRVVDCLPKGAEVTVTNRSNSSWYAVSYNGNEGFMSSKYLSISEDSHSANIVESEGSGYINAMYVRFRSGPSTSSSILGEYNTGKPVTITGTSGDWTACIINGQSGYIFSDYISYDGSYEGSFECSIDGDYEGSYEDNNESSDSNSDDGFNRHVDGSQFPDDEQNGEIIVKPVEPEERPNPDDGQSGEIIVMPEEPEQSPEPEEPEQSPEPEIGITPCEPTAGYITGDYVRFRNGPSTSSSIIDSYNKGQEITVTGTCGDWTACTIEGQDGFVYSSYVKLKDSEEEPVKPDEGTETNEPGYITGNNVRFRSAPSTDSEILGEFFYGNNVTINGISGDWTAVTYNGQSGYVFSRYVTEGEYSHKSSGGTELGRQIADYALQFVGYNYTWGGASPETGFDCSGLMYYVYQQFGYTLNRVACDQARNGVHVDPSDMQPGDLICFYSGDDYIGHVGMYIGNNMFVHAANSRTGVVTTELSGYYQDRGYEVRRII